jgi:BMFP domain-containing protein YqiC
MEKVEEINNIEETDNKMEMKAKTLDELKVAKDQIEKKIAEMEEAKKEGGMIKEAVDPNLIAGIIGLLFGSLPILYTLIKQYVGAKTPEDKKKVIAQAADTISKKMSGGMEEAKKKVEKAIYDDEDDSEDPLYLELVDELGEKILHKLFDQGWDIDDIAADPQGAAASLKRK